MKKEKKDVLTYDKEKMKKNFTTCYKITNIFEAILIGAILFILISLGLLGILTALGAKNENEKEIVNDTELIQTIKNDDGKFNTEELAQIFGSNKDATFITDLNNFQNNYPTIAPTIITILVIIGIAVKGSGIFIAIYILDKLKNIFKNTADNSTPFTEENVKSISKINLFLSLFILLFSKAGFITIILCIASISSITYIFKYGYELQKESDELL